MKDVASGPSHEGGGGGPGHGGGFESYQYEEDESRVHFELRTSHAHNARRQLTILWTSLFFVILIGALLGMIAAGIVFFETLLVTGRTSLLESAFNGGDACDPAAVPSLRARDSAASIGAAYATYALFNTCLILLASLATYLAPLAAASGLPPLKAFLNGVNVPWLLSSSTLVAKVVGVTCVVATGLPLGREGPMVHTGAIVAARVTRAKLALSKRFRYITPIETRVPSAQRNWVGVGCAAGVAAAFNAPLGGILYSFEEVCSHWSSKMTWRSFLCVVVAAIVYNLLINAMFNSDSALLKSGLVLNLAAPGARPDTPVLEFFALAIVGALGGLLGGLYVTGVASGNALRRRVLGPHPRLKVLEATVLAFVAFSILFAFPFAFQCRPCAEGMSVSGYACVPPDPNATDHGPAVCSGSGSGSGSSGRRLDAIFGEMLPLQLLGRRRLGAGASSVSYVQWQCPPHHYNEMASLIHTGQEGLILHLLERGSGSSAAAITAVSGSGSTAAVEAVAAASTALADDHTFDWNVLLPFLAVYMVIAIAIFGIFVPAGNFVPALTIGCGMGRLMGVLLNSLGFAVDPGTYALMGAAAVLGGVTRMTLTLGVILAEVTDDAAAVLPMMLVLTVAKAVGDVLSPSFDHAMMHLQHLPFLDEEPPPEFDVLTARDVMARSVVVLREVERVGDLIAVLKRTRHNGFPIVDVGRHQHATFFAGLILRRQLLVLLRERLWEQPRVGEEWLPGEARRRFVDSAFASTGKVLSTQKLTQADCDARIDLRPFMDPSPYLVNELMPLRRVYRLFNEIGVRHLCVIDCREQVVGIITRKDIQPESIEARLCSEEHLAEVKELLERAPAGVRRGSIMGASAAALKKSFMRPRQPAAAGGPAGGPSSLGGGQQALAPAPGGGGAPGGWELTRCATRRQLADGQARVRVRYDTGILNSRRSTKRCVASPKDAPPAGSEPARAREVSEVELDGVSAQSEASALSVAAE